MDQEQLLKMPLNELDFSKDFLKTCGLMRMETLDDLLKEKAGLVKKEHFSYLWLEELLSLLEEHKLLYLLQPLPGSIRD